MEIGRTNFAKTVQGKSHLVSATFVTVTTIDPLSRSWYVARVPHRRRQCYTQSFHALVERKLP